MNETEISFNTKKISSYLDFDTDIGKIKWLSIIMGFFHATSFLGLYFAFGLREHIYFSLGWVFLSECFTYVLSRLVNVYRKKF